MSVHLIWKPSLQVQFRTLLQFTETMQHRVRADSGAAPGLGSSLQALLPAGRTKDLRPLKGPTEGGLGRQGPGLQEPAGASRERGGRCMA